MLSYININSGGFAGMPSLDVIQLRLDPFDIQVELYTICSCCGARSSAPQHFLYAMYFLNY